MSSLTLDAEALYRELVHGLAPLLRANTHVVGVASGGVWLAQRMQRDGHVTNPVGTISSAMHRDDFAQRGLGAKAASGLAQTELPFDVDGAHIVVLDDVLYTGRTIRAVLNELFDYGRPAKVQLAVLVDRGGRELPVQADFAAARVALPARQSLALTVTEQGVFSFEVQD